MTGESLNYDSGFCGKVPLHQTNMVQPHGVLLVLRKEDFSILQCSENVVDFFGIEPRAMVNTSLQQFLTAQAFERIQTRLDKTLPGKIPVSFELNGTPFLALIEAQADCYIAEVERVDTTQDSFIDLYQDLKFSMTAIESAGTTEEACAIIAKELKAISGFDKVMIYRFDKDWNGEVIAEEREASMEAYLGLKFPASDIPKQARDLYKINPYRLIPNVNYTPIRLYPVLNPVTHTFTNLSNSNLRSVAGVHIEYLRNMQVTASMSTRILKNGELWGLIACHHCTPKYLSYQACSVFELLSNIISAKIASVENSNTEAGKAAKHQLLAKVVEGMYKSGSLAEGLKTYKEDVIQLLAAGGVALIQGKSTTRIGETPEEPDLQDLLFWLQSRGVSKAVQVPNLSSEYDVAADYAAKASGLLTLPIEPDKGVYLLAFRPEEVQEVSWSGNPNEAIQFEPDRKAYHPRASFALWQQKVVNTAVEWTATELEVAELFRAFLIEYSLNKMQR